MPVFVPLLLSLGLAGAMPNGTEPIPTPKLAVVDTLKVGGGGGWDYISLDSEAGRLYIPRSNWVMVLGLDGSLKGEILDTDGVHGVAFSRELDRGWTSNGKSNSVTVFKLSTLTVEKVVKSTGEKPDAILFDSATKQVFVCNGHSKNVTVINAATSEVVGTIPAGGTPESAVSDGKGRVFVNNEDGAEIMVINARTLKVEVRWSIKPLEAPTGLALDAKHNRLFSVGKNKLMAIVDTDSGKLLTTLPIGAGTDAAAFDAATGSVFASNGEGTLTVIHQDDPDHYSVIATVPTQKNAKTLALDPNTHRLYLPSADSKLAPPDLKATPRPSTIPSTFQVLVVGEAR